MAHETSTASLHPLPSRSPTRTNRRADWLLPAGLIALGAVPMIAGAVRLVELSTDPAVTPDNARFLADPVPAVVHILGATLFCTAGAFQLAPGLRRRHRAWHRAAGRALAPAGIAAALSGIWLTAAYPVLEREGAPVFAVRLAAGIAMAAFLALGLLALRRRDFAAHGRWMIRGYAIGIGAGTQVFTHIPWFLFEGIRNERTAGLLMAAGWAINLGVAEWIIRRGSRGAPKGDDGTTSAG